MTLRYTIRAFLQHLLDWAKKEQSVWGAYKNHYQQKLDEERLLSRLRKEAKQKAKAGK